MTAHLQTWVPGLTVGSYVLARELARGGMGEIWLARQASTPEFDRLVVLKRVIGSSGDDSSAMTMFLDEARIASKLSHPNVVQVFELGRDGGSVFLVMEYLTGQTLSRFARKMIETAGRVPPSLAVTLIAAAARGLGYAHRRVDLEGKPLHIVHRDVSPQNLFVTYDGEVKVLDFGIARAAGRLGKTMTGVVKGKVAYMSPEQAAGGGVEITGAADVYALGIILFELVTGTRFYRELDDLGVLRRLAISAEAPRPSSRGVPVETALEALIMRALAPEPADRFVDGQAFSESLDAWLRANPPAVHEPTLRATMHQLFAPEVGALGEFHRQAAATPAIASNPSMPDRVSTPADKSADTRAHPLPAERRPGLGTNTSPLPSVPEERRPPSLVTDTSPIAEDRRPPSLVTDTSPIAEDRRPPSLVTRPSQPVAERAPEPRRPNVPAPRPTKTPLVGALLTGLIIAAVVAVGFVAWPRASLPSVSPPAAIRPADSSADLIDAGPPALAAKAPNVDPPAHPPMRPEAAVEQTPPPPARPEPVVQTPPTGSPQPRAPKAGSLSLNTEPWTRVFLGKKALGDTPLIGVAIPSGTHRLRLVNEAEHIDTVIEVKIQPNETTVKKIAF
ncbi:MAG: protein kinase [Archangium sp.]|nr:protein kinase [Archangium sp.]